VRAAVWSWEVDPAGHEALLAALAGRGQPALAAVEGLGREELAGLWERGWTPADVAHVVARRQSAVHADVVARFAVADGQRRADSGQRLHPRWVDQLTVLAERGQAGGSPPLDSGLRLAVEVVGLLTRLPEVPRTVPAPGERSRGPVLRTAGLDERLLARVRALLAKAESTGFDEEAEALTAKAQELIARHAIDEALLHADDDVGEPSVRRIPVDDPYADAKASLLSEVAGANRCRVVHSPDLGWVTAFGYEGDLDAVELLATSLLAQATGAMARHGSRRDAHGRSRTRSFRRAFLLGFAYRVGQRLREATDAQVAAATSSDHGRLLPVLAARDDRLDAAQRAAFPHITQRSASVSSSAGWVAGQAAADLADLDVYAGAIREPRAS
jgi:cell division septum initiation protein DivIVA